MSRKDSAGKLSTVKPYTTTVEWLKYIPRCRKSFHPGDVQGQNDEFATTKATMRPPSAPVGAYPPHPGAAVGSPHPLAASASANPSRFGRCRLPARQAAARARFTATPTNKARR